MLTNASATLYRRIYNPQTRLDTWQREFIPAVWWFRSESSSVDADGLHRADTVTVRIPDISIQIKKEDILVKGECDVDIQKPSDLEDVEAIKVMAVNYNNFGDTPHIKVGGQ